MIGKLAAASLLLLSAFTTSAVGDKGDCSQPLSTGSGPAASDCLFILKVAVGSEECEVECICAPKGTLPPAASDALLCLKKAVGQNVTHNCPCAATTTTLPPTTTTLASGVVGAIPFEGRMNSNALLGLPAAQAACEEEFPGSHFCEYSELQASEGAKLTGLKDIHDDTVTSFWAIDANQPVARQCGQTLSAGSTRWVYNTAHLGIGGDSVTLNTSNGTLGTLVQGGGANRNCFDSKWVACCK